MKLTLRSWPGKIKIASKCDYFNLTDHSLISSTGVNDAMRWLRSHFAVQLMVNNLRQLLSTEKIMQSKSMADYVVFQKVAELLFRCSSAW